MTPDLIAGLSVCPLSSEMVGLMLTGEGPGSSGKTGSSDFGRPPRALLTREKFLGVGRATFIIDKAFPARSGSAA